MKTYKIIASDKIHYENLISAYLESGYEFVYKGYLSSAVENGENYITISLI